MLIKRELEYYEAHPGEASVNELIAIRDFILNPCEASKEAWIKKRLGRERQKYIKKGISRERWPKSLQDLPEEEFIQYPVSSIPSQKIEKANKDSPPPVEVKPIKIKYPDSFRSDEWGTLLGEEEQGIIPYVNKRKCW